jgi:hypothetical protein
MGKWGRRHVDLRDLGGGDGHFTRRPLLDQRLSHVANHDDRRLSDVDRRQAHIDLDVAGRQRRWRRR